MNRTRNRILIALGTTTLLCGNLLAQSPQPGSQSMPPEQQAPSPEQATPTSTPATAPPSQASAPSKFAPGSIIPVQLTRSIDAKKARAGDEVVTRVTQDLRNDAGAVIVAKDTKVVGHITQVQARSKEQKESEVAISFDRVLTKNGEPMQLPMSIQAIIAPPNANSNAAGAQPTAGYPAPGGATTSSGGRMGSAGTMGGTSPGASVPQTAGTLPSGTPSGTQAQQPITGNTKGVVGIANLSLSTAADTMQGSVVSSEKNNVKLDDGTFLLLRVDQ